jgi:hypothetical protein
VGRFAQLARHAEVDEHDAAVGQDQVVRLDVAVDDVLLVDVVEGLAGLRAPLDDVLERQAGRAADEQPVVQALALDELQDDEVVALVAEVIDDAHDARVVELREEPRLDLEARDVAGVKQPLDGDEAARVPIQRPMHGAHGAAGDGGLNLIVARKHGPRSTGRHGLRV